MKKYQVTINRTSVTEPGSLQFLSMLDEDTYSAEYITTDENGNEVHEIEVSDKFSDWLESQLDQADGIVSYAVPQAEENKYVKLIKLANNAKDISQYSLANIVFATLLQDFFDWSEDGPIPAALEWETEDESGDYHSEAYFDLLVIVSSEETAEGLYHHRLNIPIPMLNLSPVVISALKTALIVPRLEHCRDNTCGEAEQISELWQEFFNMVPAEDIVQALSHLCDDIEMATAIVRGIDLRSK